MKSSILLGSTVMIIVVLISTAAFIHSKDQIPEKHIEVVLRDIGHQLLLSAKDSTSRVLPIRQLNENSYQISFQNNVGFISDSLINIVHRTFSGNELANNYIVNLRNCEKKETVLAFEMNGRTGDLTPCRGRRLGLGCYVIEIDLIKESRLNFLWLLLLIIPLAFAWFYFSGKFSKKADQQMISDIASYIPVGNLQFYSDNNVLKAEHKTINLSEKENKALKIFVQNINEVVEREKLMKELWEDEGTVVISRNVDVLVSKLRKKLSDDGSIKLTNVHGRGYKLIIE